MPPPEFDLQRYPRTSRDRQGSLSRMKLRISPTKLLPVDLCRDLVLHFLTRIAEVLEGQLLEQLLLQRLGPDPQLEQFLRIVQLIAEIADVELVQPQHLDRKIV